jgi:hypothetical protein
MSPPPDELSDLSSSGVVYNGELSLTIIHHEEAGGLQSEIIATPDQQLQGGLLEANRSTNISWSSCSGSSVEQQTDPVFEWWRELLGHTEPECMTYLQSKPILRPAGVEVSGGSGDSGPLSSRHKIRFLLEAQQNIQHNIKVFKR